MSSVLHPVGPERPGTYWVRRAVLLAAIVLVVVVVIWAIPKPPLRADPAGQGSTGASKPASTPASVSPTPTATSPSTPPPIVACVASAITVTTTGPTKVTADKNAQFKVTVANAGTIACKLAINTDTFELRVVSGSDRIWTTDHCAKWLPTVKQTTVGPGKALSVTITWQGRRSAADCTLHGGLRPGTYVAKALYGDADPGNLILSLR